MKLLTLTTFITLISFPALAQDFQCRHSRTADEVVICQSPVLSRLDEKINRTYARALRRSHGGDTIRLTRSQRAWLASRRACGVRVSCIRAHYVRRIGELKAYD
jgi:uncharacterized protein